MSTILQWEKNYEPAFIPEATKLTAATGFLSSLIITLFGVASLYAGSQVTEVQQYVRLSQNIIQRYEQAGDYATALKIARNSCEELLKLGFAHKAARHETLL